MSPAEQHHSIALAHAVEVDPRVTPDLITAALLHDVGKTLCPPRLWERVAVVLLEHFVANPTTYLNKTGFTKLQQAYDTRIHHAMWGADLAEQAGASSRVVALIRQHHDDIAHDEDLKLLQWADDT